MELIDKKAFVEKCLKYFDNGLVCENVATEICDSHATCIECIIDTMPLIDAVPVVRCKDCKCWGNELNWGGHRRGICDFFEILTDADGYCYRAVRKEVQE